MKEKRKIKNPEHGISAEWEEEYERRGKYSNEREKRSTEQGISTGESPASGEPLT